MNERPPRSPNPKPEVDLALRPIEPGGPLFAAALFDTHGDGAENLSLSSHSLLFDLPGFRSRLAAVVEKFQERRGDASRFRCKG